MDRPEQAHADPPPLSGLYARWLFGAAAAFNLAIGLGLLLFRATLTSLLGLSPAAGINLVTYYLTASFVTLFGFSYLRVSANPERYRAYISLGLIGKLAATVAIVAIGKDNPLPPAMLALAGADGAFSVLFFAYLRRTPEGREG